MLLEKSHLKFILVVVVLEISFSLGFNLEAFPWMRCKSILKFGSGIFIVCLTRFDFEFSVLMGVFEFYVFVFFVSSVLLESKKDWLDGFYFELIMGFRCDFDDE